MPDSPYEGRVALVIPTLDGGQRFEAALARWRSQAGVGRLELVCPDSGSQDGTVGAIRRHGGKTLPIAPSHFNHGETRNRAVATTTTDYVILSVQDAVPVDDRVALELLQPLERDPRVAATYGRQTPRPDCHPVLAARIDAWAGGTTPQVQELGDRGWSELSPLERLGLVRYDHVIACIRRTVWEHQRFEQLPFGEDVAWAARVIRAGWRITFVPGAVVEHSHDRSARDEARRIYCDHANLNRLLGLVTVPSRRDIEANVEAARAHYRALVEARTDVEEETRQHWTEWADQLAHDENWAQFLGGNFARRWWFKPIDRWLRKGI